MSLVEDSHAPHDHSHDHNEEQHSIDDHSHNFSASTASTGNTAVAAATSTSIAVHVEADDDDLDPNAPASFNSQLSALALPDALLDSRKGRHVMLLQSKETRLGADGRPLQTVTMWSATDERRKSVTKRNFDGNVDKKNTNAGVVRRIPGFNRVEHLRDLHIDNCLAGGDQSWFLTRGRAYRSGRGDCGQLGGKRVPSMGLPTLYKKSWKPKETKEETDAVADFRTAKSSLFRTAQAISEQGRITLREVRGTIPHSSFFFLVPCDE